MKNINESSNAGEISYHVPEGSYRAKLVSVKCVENKGENPQEGKVRFHFRLEVPGSGVVVFMAGRNFVPNIVRGSNLANFLEGWLGDKIRVLEQSDGDLRALVGEEGEVQIRHIHTDQAYPFVNLESIRPLGQPPVRLVSKLNIPRIPVPASAPLIVTVKSNPTGATLVPVPPTANTTACPCCGSIKV